MTGATGVRLGVVGGDRECVSLEEMINRHDKRSWELGLLNRKQKRFKSGQVIA